MPKDIKTNITVGVKTKGISEAKQSTTAFNKSLLKSLEAQTKGFAEAVKNIEKLCRATEQSGEKTVRTNKKVTESIKRKTAAEKEAERQAKRVLQETERATRRAQRQAEQDEQKRRGAFRQGLIQGGLPMPAAFIQRGPGMGRQMAGMAIGGAVGGTMRTGMGMGGGLANAAFSGIGGVQQALGAIPLLGGAAAGMLGSAAANAGRFVQFQRQRIGMASILASPMDRKRVAQKSKDLQDWENKNAKLQDMEDELRYARYNREQDIGGNFRLAGLTAAEMKASNKKYPQMWTAADIQEATKAGEKDVALQKSIQAQRKIVEKSRPKAGRGLDLGLGGISGMGLSLMGVGRAEAEQMAAGIVQAGGGRMGGARDQDIIRTGFAAKTMYGIQEGVSGAFLKGGRQGGIVGGRDQAGRAMTEAIQDGLRLGLEGSELNDYLQSIASGIQQFEMTGIPVAKDSIAGMSQAFAVAGIASTRASRAAQGLTSYAQGIGQRGIKSSMDLLLLQRLGGYQGGGAKELQDAFIQLEEMKGGLLGKGVNQINVQDATSNVLREVMQKGGGGTSGEFELKSSLQAMNVNMSNKEIRLFAKRLRGEPLTPNEQKIADDAFKQRVRGEEEAAFIGQTDKGGRITGLQRAARTEVSRLGGAAKAQAGIENRQLAQGGRIVGSVQALERSALNTSDAFTKLVDGPLKNFSAWMEKTTASLSTLVDKGQKGTLTKGDVVGAIWKGLTGEN